jgi:hypothetical protein
MLWQFILEHLPIGVAMLADEYVSIVHAVSCSVHGCCNVAEKPTGQCRHHSGMPNTPYLRFSKVLDPAYVVPYKARCMITKGLEKVGINIAKMHAEDYYTLKTTKERQRNQRIAVYVHYALMDAAALVDNYRAMFDCWF